MILGVHKELIVLTLPFNALFALLCLMLVKDGNGLIGF